MMKRLLGLYLVFVAVMVGAVSLQKDTRSANAVSSENDFVIYLPVVICPETDCREFQPIDETPRASDVKPRPEVLDAVEKYQDQDPDASFSFFNGYVDSFATRPKKSIPDYAVPILEELGLLLDPQEPELFPDPTRDEKYVQSLDDDLTRMLPVALEDLTGGEPPPDDHSPDPVGNDPGSGIDPKEELRTKPAIILEPRDSDWQPPNDELKRLESQAAGPILEAMLAANEALFNVNPREFTLEMEEYQVGRFFRRALFNQRYGRDMLLDGKVAVLFDINWNVIGISRMIMTPDKLPIEKEVNVGRDEAFRIALEAAVEATGEDVDMWQLVELELGVEPVRRIYAWQVRLVIPEKAEFDLTVLIDAATGEVLNISDNVTAFRTDDGAFFLDDDPVPGEDGKAEGIDFSTLSDLLPNSPSTAAAFTDAKVRRWAYSNGDVTGPFQVTSSNFYTRDDNTLVHDFFYMATDQRGGGTAMSTCSQTPDTTMWRANAYGSTSSSSFIRHTHRSDRDFSLWSPASSDGTFAESHNYYWSRWFFQWLKPALKELGVLPSSASNYHRALFIINACIDDIGYANSSFSVTTQHNEGEGSYVIRLREDCRAGLAGCSTSEYAQSRSNHYLTCDGSGCAPTPSVIHHEINHFILGKYFGVGSGLDCGSGNQLKMIHEGLMGSIVPQAYWHHYYGVGYNPNTDRLFTADQVRGRVHSSPGTLLTLNNYLCVNNTSGLGPYSAGRVPGQAMWKFYHGVVVNGSSFSSTWRPSTDTDFLILSYWAADLVANSTYKDRYEYANRVMEILDKYSNWSSSAKGEYCDIWDTHNLDNFINPAYCS